MWNKTTYPFLVQALCIIPLKSIRMWASFRIFVILSTAKNLKISGKIHSARIHRFYQSLFSFPQPSFDLLLSGYCISNVRIRLVIK